jgi:2-methylcitrate dehydratase PrpD
LQPDVMMAATRCLVDLFAVSLAGTTETAAASTANLVCDLGGKSEATLISTGTPTTAPLAAFGNGALAHALDYDDTLWSYVGHVTAVVLPAALAVAESQNCRGRDLLAAFAIGAEAAHLIGERISEGLRARGFHPTPAIGVFGAAVASALLQGADSHGMAGALTLAANMSSGVRQNFGSPAKPMSVGWAAQAGVMAARLAQQGLSGSADAIEGPQGFCRAVSGIVVPSAFAESTEMALVSPGVGFKLYPCCTGTHPTVEALSDIRKKHSLQPGQIDSIRVEVTPEVIGELIYQVPADARQARFSLPFCAATALVDGAVALHHFAEPLRMSPEVRDLMRRVKMSPRDDLPRSGEADCPAARVTVRTRDGRRVQKWVGCARGNPSNPASDAELERKFYECASQGEMTQTESEELLEELKRLQDIPRVGEWLKEKVLPLLRARQERAEPRSRQASGA